LGHFFSDPRPGGASAAFGRAGLDARTVLARRVRISSGREDDLMRELVVGAVVAVLVAGAGLAGCEKGPMQKAGEKVDEVTGEDRLIGRGPAEKTGRKIDNTVDDVKK
jgi:hypothetical protein